MAKNVLSDLFAKAGKVVASTVDSAFVRPIKRMTDPICQDTSAEIFGVKNGRLVRLVPVRDEQDESRIASWKPESDFSDCVEIAEKCGVDAAFFSTLSDDFEFMSAIALLPISESDYVYQDWGACMFGRYEGRTVRLVPVADPLDEKRIATWVPDPNVVEYINKNELPKSPEAKIAAARIHECNVDEDFQNPNRERFGNYKGFVVNLIPVKDSRDGTRIAEWIPDPRHIDIVNEILAEMKEDSKTPTRAAMEVTNSSSDFSRKQEAGIVSKELLKNKY